MHLYKILSTASWDDRDQAVPLAELDVQDGFVHLSSQSQVRETAEKYFSDQTRLTLVVIESEALPAGSLRWEVSRGGQRFPHVYAAVPLTAVVESRELVGDEPGAFRFPPEVLDAQTS